MKWITHQTGALLTAFALGLPVTGVAAACAGAILPDALDIRASRLGRTSRAQKRIFNKIHRGASHWFGWWLLLFIFLCFYPLPILAKDILAGLAFGALSHVFLDMLTPRGIPVLPFTRKGSVALPICSTGHASEYIFLTAMVAIGLWLMWDNILVALVQNGARF